MNQFEVAQGFIEQCQAGASIETLARSFPRCTETLGFRHFACCSHVDPLDPPRRAVMLHTYPREWVKLFSECEFFEVDPVFLRASRTLLPFFWDTQALSDELSPPQQEIFHEARRYGLARGYTVPIHSIDTPKDFRASCSVLPDSDASQCLLAWGCAGTDLAVANGAPLRLVAPGRRGVDWVKWIDEIVPVA